MKKRSRKIGNEVLMELDWFDERFVAGGGSAVVRVEQLRRMGEPFVGWVRVMESIDGKAETERIYLVCRGHTPLNFEPKNPIALFANRDAKAGRIASIDPGNELTISLPYNRGQKTMRVVEKNIFNPVRREVWDARNNQIAFHLDDEYVTSLRAALGVAAPAVVVPVVDILEPADEIVAPGADGRATLDELRTLEEAHRQDQRDTQEEKLNRVREIVESIALKDQPVLDSAQDEFCRMPLNSQLILSGSPGTGKTTSVIKRIAMKAGASHLEETDGISLSEDDRTNWLIFTPNDLLKIYLKEAMNKEGLSATDQFVTTWERERGILGRDVLGFLKRGDKGLFSKTENVLLSNPSSAGTSHTALEFIAFFDQEFLSALQTALESISGVKIDPRELTNRTFSIGEKFRTFTAAASNLRSKLNDQLPYSGGLKSISAIEDLSMLSVAYSNLRRNADNLINEFVDSWIEMNPTRFDDIVEFVQASAEDNKSLLTDDLEAATEDNLDEIGADVDPRLKARSKIRQVLAQESEASAVGRKLRGKDAQFIWEYLEMTDETSNDLRLVGRLRLALKPAILRISSFNRFLAEIPRSYQRFRISNLEAHGGSNYWSDSRDAVENHRISAEEIDILIFAIFRIASILNDSSGPGIETEKRRELLGRIADQYRTHIAVDEATDFSAIQLASIYYLTDPRYRAVTFSGDLMQRVTTVGLGDWKELEALIPTVERFELVASYRQTPMLLNTAKKLYTNIIGEEPPFDSRYHSTGDFPPPLKYAGALDDNLGDWLASRVYEIYRINGESLPSIAIFVPTESDIDPAHKILKEALNEYSIDVEPCKLGKILGTGSNIRVFSIEFIKGLEFEGVFYIDIDRSYEHHPELVDKYLYVGLTRATTFLGVTYADKIPEAFGFLDEDLVDGDWTAFL
ncbi:MAG: ATP-binding domain-containing protein [Acidobacteria bacterium]|nr:ATP-binding domain-containing protein [Acidobacteriota bacterium]